MKRVLTPVEVEALSEPAVQAKVDAINAALVAGERSFTVDAGIAARVKVALESAGWSVDDKCAFDTFTLFIVKPMAN